MSIVKKRRSEKSASYDHLHPKNPFKENEPDFCALSKSFPQLQSCLKDHNGRTTLDWKDPSTSRIVTNVLLQNMFDVTLNIPENNLCPPLPNRINYLCWISDLLGDSKVISQRVLDIGAGPLCIYPVLGYKMFNWQFIGTDIDPVSIQWGNANLLRNSLENNIQLLLVSDSTKCQAILAEKYLPALDSNAGTMLDAIGVDGSGSSLNHKNQGPILTATAVCSSQSSSVSIDAVMTNPPFYDINEQIIANDHSVCTGSENELRTLGGEVAFICAMIADSLLMQSRIQWYTAMVGKKSSLTTLMTVLQKEKVPSSQVFTTAFKQGRTTRWGLAWTFDTEAAARYSQYVQKTRRQSKQIDDMDWVIQISVSQLYSTRLKEETREQSAESSVRDRIVRAVAESLANRDTRLTLLQLEVDEYSLLWDKQEVGRLVAESGALSDSEVEVKAWAEFAANIGTLVDEVETVQQQFMQFKTEFDNNMVRTNRRWRRRLAMEQSDNHSKT